MTDQEQVWPRRSPARPASSTSTHSMNTINAVPGDVVYVNMPGIDRFQRGEFICGMHRPTNQVTVIYKVRNESELPFAEGIVRSYQNGLFHLAAILWN